MSWDINNMIKSDQVVEEFPKMIWNQLNLTSLLARKLTIKGA